MKKYEICDCIEFARAQLATVIADMKRIEGIHGEPVPNTILESACGTGVAYNLGRAQSIAERSRVSLEFVTGELAKCLPVSNEMGAADGAEVSA